MAAVGQVMVYSRSERISHLRNKLTSLEDYFDTTQTSYQDRLRYELRMLAEKRIRLGNTERVSIYKHDGQAFEMLCRFSKNPALEVPGRGIYPDNVGCIAEAWREGEAHEPNLPSPRTDLDGWLDQQKSNWGITKKVARQFPMKSRCYCAHAIERQEGTHDRMAVIVFESTKANGLNADLIDLILNKRGEAARLADLIERLEALEPSLRYAREEGY